MGEEGLIVYSYFVVLNIILGIITVKYDTSIKKVNLGHLLLYILFISASILGTMVWAIVYNEDKDFIYNTRKKSRPITKFKIR